MSDRARSSVRTDSREGSAAADAEPVDATQATEAPEPAPATTGPDGAGADAPASPAPGGATAATVRPLAGQPTPGPAEETRAVSTSTPPMPATGQGNRISAGVRSASARSAAPMDATQSVTLPPAGVRPAEPVRPSAEPPRAPAAPRATADGARPASKGRRGPRRARLQLRHIDTWSALKISLVVSIALFFVWMVAVGILYGVLSGLGVFDSINDLIGQVSTSTGGEAVESFTITAGLVFTGAAVIGAVNILLLTALCTVGTFVYNLCSDLVGGLELTLAERE